MVRFFPVRSQRQFDTPGERRFAERLERLLEDDYLCWSNVPVGPKARYPDFVVLHPRRRILMLEVKDWQISAIQSRGIYGSKVPEIDLSFRLFP